MYTLAGFAGSREYRERARRRLADFGEKTSGREAGVTALRGRPVWWHRACFSSLLDPIHSFRDLEVWQRSMDLVGLVCEATRALPAQEFDLRRQMRDASLPQLRSREAKSFRSATCASRLLSGITSHPSPH